MSTEHEIEKAKAAAVGMTLLHLAGMTDGLTMLGARLDYAGAAGITIGEAGQQIDLLTGVAVAQTVARQKTEQDRAERNAGQIQKTLDAAVAHIRKVRAMPNPETLSLEELNGLTAASRRLTGLYAEAAGLAIATAIARVFNEVDGVPQ